MDYNCVVCGKTIGRDHLNVPLKDPGGPGRVPGEWFAWQFQSGDRLAVVCPSSADTGCYRVLIGRLLEGLVSDRVVNAAKTPPQGPHDFKITCTRCGKHPTDDPGVCEAVKQPYPELPIHEMQVVPENTVVGGLVVPDGLALMDRVLTTTLVENFTKTVQTITAAMKDR